MTANKIPTESQDECLSDESMNFAFQPLTPNNHPYIHNGDCVAHHCTCKRPNGVCCCPDKYFTCKLGYRYWCIQCHHGLSGMYSKCTNPSCKHFNKTMFDDD